MFLAGDIGGTHTRLGLFERDGDRVRAIVQGVYKSRDYPGMAPILRAFLDGQRQPERICLGIAGPVRQGRVETPNLPWIVDADHLQDELRARSVLLINDLEANAHGLAALGPDDFAVLNPGGPAVSGNAALISAGTGLGEAGLYWDGTKHRPFASEGGHCDFAPRNALESELLVHLTAQFGRVSFERVLSGPGLHNVYEFLRQRGGRADELPALCQQFGVTDPAAAISKAGLAGQSELCVQALNLFVSIYGAEAGNLALKLLATGGVFLGGGIVPKNLAKFREPLFLEAFLDKGRMLHLLQAIPVRVVLNENTALLGAARVASWLAVAPH